MLFITVVSSVLVLMAANGTMGLCVCQQQWPSVALLQLYLRQITVTAQLESLTAMISLIAFGVRLIPVHGTVPPLSVFSLMIVSQLIIIIVIAYYGKLLHRFCDTFCL